MLNKQKVQLECLKPMARCGTMVTSFKETSTDFCAAVAAVARRFSTEFVDPQGVEALVANRGIPLDKYPGLRPVGIGEVKRRVIGKTIMQIVGSDVQGAAGSRQLCAGQSAGVEAAVHAMRLMKLTLSC